MDCPVHQVSKYNQINTGKSHLRLNDGTQTFLAYRQENMSCARSTAGVNCNSNASVRRVFEPCRHGQGGCQFTMHLRLGRSRSDRAPGDQVCRVLRANGIKELTARRQSQLGDIQEQRARNAQAFVDLEGPIEVGIVDKTLKKRKNQPLFWESEFV